MRGSSGILFFSLSKSRYVVVVVQLSVGRRRIPYAWWDRWDEVPRSTAPVALEDTMVLSLLSLP